MSCRDPKLRALLARAHHWREALTGGASIKALAKAEATSAAYIRTRLSLAFLAANIQRRIITGDHPTHWCIEHFRTKGVPICWDQQREVFL